MLMSPLSAHNLPLLSGRSIAWKCGLERKKERLRATHPKNARDIRAQEVNYMVGELSEIKIEEAVWSALKIGITHPSICKKNVTH
jgi:hypothetical protein